MSNEIQEDSSIKPLTEFFGQILRWNPKWLKKFDDIPPNVIKSIQLIPASLTYKCYDDYCKVALPFLIKECWHILKSEDRKKECLRSVELDSITLNNDHNKLTGLIQDVTGKIVIPSDDYYGTSDFPCYGDLVIIQQGKTRLPIFGYILKFERNYCFPTKLLKFQQVDIIYTIIVKPGAISSDEYIKPIVLTSVTSILSHVHMVYVLNELKNSELLDFILSPDIHRYQMIEQPSDNVIEIKDLNPKQFEVVSRVVKTIETKEHSISLIQGPPGTGKSKVIVEIVTTLTKNGYKRILLCAPSNKAIDSLVLRLLDRSNCQDCQIVRLGQQARMHDRVREYVSLPELIDRQRKRKREGSRDLIRNDIMMNADVIATTLSSSFKQEMEQEFSLGEGYIPICIIDEAGQAKELETFIPLSLGMKKLVLVGDPKQLPPTVLCQEAKVCGLDKSLFARAEENFRNKPNNPIVTLDTQYRMVGDISSWPSRYFYRGALKNQAVVPALELTNYKVLNHTSEQSDSRFSNAGEANFVVNLIFAILTKLYPENGSDQIQRDNVSFGIITPYKEQQALISSYLNSRLGVSENIKSRLEDIIPSTVDSFQGQERDIIIMSCVRSNGIGFVNDPNRLCVSLTRAKHSLFICGNFQTFKENRVWRSLINDAKSRNAFLDVDYNMTTELIRQTDIFKNRASSKVGL